MKAAARKPKNCKICGNEFFPFRTTEKVCSIDCAIEYGKQREARRYALETRKLKREHRAKDRSYQIRKAQEAFNSYIRARDAGKPCISCGKNTGCKMNAGHYLSVGGHPELRFEEKNCHLQCEHCNSYLSGNIARYRINLIDRIGLPLVEWLEGPHKPKKYTVEEIIEIKNHFRDLKKCL